jgi:uncharacterized protein (DUF952 family)
MIFHITARTEWEAAVRAGRYRAPSLASEGFIHCSAAGQVCGVANSFYPGQLGLVLLVIDPARLEAEVRWEPPAGLPPAGGHPGRLFPHVYGPLNLEAVSAVLDFPPQPDGTFTLPGDLDRASENGAS